MTRERIASLERDKRELGKKVDTLQSRLDQLAPENTGLREVLNNTRANGAVSTALSIFGGGAISYAAFAGDLSTRLANAGAVVLLVSILLMIISNIRAFRIPNK